MYPNVANQLTTTLLNYSVYIATPLYCITFSERDLNQNSTSLSYRFKIL